MAVSKQFILAGKAIFTIQLPAGSDKPHYTFKVDKVEASVRWPEAWFVKMLAGPSNESDYVYVGKLQAGTGEVCLTGKSKVTADTFAFKLLNRVLARIWANDHASYEQHGYKTHHEGKCGRCARRLTVPESIESGFGPECVKLV